MSVFDEIMKELDSGGFAAVAPSFQERIYILKKEDINPKFDEAGQIVIDLMPTANIHLVKIPARFKAVSTLEQTRFGPRYRETVSVSIPDVSLDFKHRMWEFGNSRLRVITVKESTIELFGATGGLYLEVCYDVEGCHLKLETANELYEPGPPKKISIETVDGTRSWADSVSEIERLASR